MNTSIDIVEIPAVLPVLSPEALIATAIERNVPVDALERLLAMRTQIKAENAKEAYFKALSAFQAECPVIAKSKAVMMNGSIRYHYAPLDEIVAQVGELLRRHGFAHDENSEVVEGWVTGICSAHHAAGHSESKTFKVPVDSEARMNSQQRYASALTYAKRYAFCLTFGILTGDEDDDGQAASAPPEPPRTSQATRPPQSAPPAQKTAPRATPTAARPTVAPVQAEEPGFEAEEHPWMLIICPIPPKPLGIPPAEYRNHPLTVGELLRHEDEAVRRWMFGMAMNFKAAPRTDGKGRVWEPSDADYRFEAACKDAKAHIESREESQDDRTQARG